MNYLIEIYENIIDKSVLKNAPYLVYEESSMLARIIRIISMILLNQLS